MSSQNLNQQGMDRMIQKSTNAGLKKNQSASRKVVKKYTVSMRPHTDLSAWPPPCTVGAMSPKPKTRQEIIEETYANSRISPEKMHETRVEISKEERTIKRLREKLRPEWFQIRQPQIPPGDRPATDKFLSDINIKERKARIRQISTTMRSALELDIADLMHETKNALRYARKDLHAWKDRTNHW